ncbi:uncharacterized protein LOC144559356 [Carex rostrata]
MAEWLEIDFSPPLLATALSPFSLSRRCLLSSVESLASVALPGSRDVQLICSDFSLLHLGYSMVIKKGVVIKADLNSGAMHLQSHLTNQYPVLNSTWMPRALSNNLYLVDPPHAKWRADVLSQGQVILGDVSYPVAPFDPPSHDGGYDPIQIWLNIRGFPLMLWFYMEIRRLAEELGGFLVEVDPRSSGHHDFTVLRMKIGVPKVDIVPKFRRLHFVSDNEIHKYYDLFIDIESSSHDRGTSQPLQYWQPMKTEEEVSGLEEAVDKEDSIVNKLIIGEENLNASSSNQSDVRDKNSFSVLAEIDTSEELYIGTWNPRIDLAVENSSKEENGNEGDKKNEKKRCDKLKLMEKPPLPPEPRHSAGLKRKDPIAKEGTRKGTKLKESLPTPSGQRDGYHEFRKFAQHNWNVMKSYYQSANSEYLRGNHRHASFLAGKGRYHCNLARAEDEKASIEIFRAMNNAYENASIIDLHGQHVKEGIAILKNQLVSFTYKTCEEPRHQ